jgi:hypothetical protein
MPDALSPKIGFGMNVATLPCFFATILTTFLYVVTLSAIVTSSSNFMSISHWPAVATSWWCASVSMPKLSSRMLQTSLRKSTSVSCGGAG